MSPVQGFDVNYQRLFYNDGKIVKRENFAWTLRADRPRPLRLILTPAASGSGSRGAGDEAEPLVPAVIASRLAAATCR